MKTDLQKNDWSGGRQTSPRELLLDGEMVLGAVGRATAFAFAVVLSFTAIGAGFASALAFAVVLALTGMLVAIEHRRLGDRHFAGYRVDGGARRGDPGGVGRRCRSSLQSGR